MNINKGNFYTREATRDILFKLCVNKTPSGLIISIQYIKEEEEKRTTTNKRKKKISNYQKSYENKF